MKVHFRKRFLKDLSSLPVSFQNKIEVLVFKTIPALSAQEIYKKVKKMHGYRNFYKMRVGDYRIGIKITQDEIILERVLHRKDIYKFFP
ncbi:MAG: type II toxin-antitoxin system RelE/ParE family toxin [Melioribacteraceae bacterium]|nr:type II toxin-antitoxin system RelE/ParE family toxin [Melioribacteraceae bacterium]